MNVKLNKAYLKSKKGDRIQVTNDLGRQLVKDKVAKEIQDDLQGEEARAIRLAQETEETKPAKSE